MPRIVRGALVQATWTGDKESMIQKHEERAHEAAKQGAQFILFQELFYGPYFCQVQDAQYYSYTELIPDGPTTKRMQDLAKQTGMVVVAPMYEEDEKASGHLLQHRRRHRRRRHATSASTARPTSRTSRASGRSSTSGPGNLGYPVFETAVGKIGVYICYDRHFPEGARALGLNGAEIVLIPSRHLARPVRVPVADRAGQPRRRQRLLRRHDQPGRHRGRLSATTTSTARATSWTRAASSSATSASAHDEELIVRDLDLDLIARGPQHLAVLPRPPARRATRTSRAPRTRYHPSGSAVWRRTAEPLVPRRGRRTDDAVRLHAQARPHDRAHAGADPPGRGGRVRLRLAVRLARPVARAVPLLTLMAQATRRGCASAPASPTRPPASRRSPRRALAVLDELSGGRMDLGIGRGDSARRVLGKPPTTMADARGGDRASSRASSRAAPSTYEGAELRLPVDRLVDAAGLGRRLRPDGAGDDRPDRRRGHPPAGRSRTSSAGSSARSARRRRRRAAIRRRSRSRPRRRPTSAPRELGRERTRWFPALVCNHVVDLVNKYPREQLPESLTGYIRDRDRLRLPPPRRGRLVERGLRRRRGDRPVLRPRRAPTSTSPSSASSPTPASTSSTST